MVTGHPFAMTRPHSAIRSSFCPAIARNRLVRGADRQPGTRAGAGVGYHELKASLRALELPAKLLGLQFFVSKGKGSWKR